MNLPLRSFFIPWNGINVSSIVQDLNFQKKFDFLTLKLFRKWIYHSKFTGARSLSTKKTQNAYKLHDFSRFQLKLSFHSKFKKLNGLKCKKPRWVKSARIKNNGSKTHNMKENYKKKLNLERVYINSSCI